MKYGKEAKGRKGRDVRPRKRDAWQHTKMETCKNPFRKRRCDKTDIVILFWHNDELLPICSSCWKKICDKDWNEHDSIEEFIYKPMRGLEFE